VDDQRDIPPDKAGEFRQIITSRDQAQDGRGVIDRAIDIMTLGKRRDDDRGNARAGPEFDDLPPQYLENVENKPPFGGPVAAAPVLRESDVADLVAFMNTLTDGWTP
jgi:hypothetical protein